MKNSINNVVVASAVALFAANVNADSIHKAISFQADANSAVEASANNTGPRVTIQDYVEAARANAGNSAAQTSVNENGPRVTIQDYVEAARADATQASNQTTAVRS